MVAFTTKEKGKTEHARINDAEASFSNAIHETIYEPYYEQRNEIIFTLNFILAKDIMCTFRQF